MRILSVALSIVFMLVGCQSQAQTKTEKNRVIVMGMVHSHHRTKEQFSLDKVKQFVRAVKPDLVLTEIPPDRLEAATRQFESDGKITEPRVSRFPEYVDALFHLTREMQFEIIPCAAWTKSMNDSRRETMAQLKKTHSRQYEEMEAAQANADVEIGKMGSIHDPHVIHTDSYDEFVRAGMQPYDKHFNELIGQGGWTNINKAHYALIEKALDKYTGQGKTVLITFGAWHKYYIKDQLKKRDDIELISFQQFLPKKDSEMNDWARFRLTPDNTGSSGETEIKKPELAWQFDTGEVIESSPAVVGDTVYIGGHSKRLFAINRETGEKRWEFSSAGWVRASPAVVDSIVYFGSDDNKFYALDASNGKKKWDFDLGQGGEQSSPAVADGVVYFGGFDHFVYALDATSGKQKWKFDAGASMLSSPALSSDAVFIATYAGKVFAIERSTGKKVWSFQANDKPVFSSPVYKNGKIYITSYDNHIYSLNANTGQQVWKYETEDEIFSSPAISDGTLFVGSNDQHLYALDADSGKLKWKSNLNGAVFASPTVSTNSIYVGSSDGYMYCLERKTGKQRWRYLVKEGANVWSSAAAVNGRIYFGSHAGSVIVLKEDLGE